MKSGIVLSKPKPCRPEVSAPPHFDSNSSLCNRKCCLSSCISTHLGICNHLLFFQKVDIWCHLLDPFLHVFYLIGWPLKANTSHLERLSSSPYTGLAAMTV